MRRYSGYLTLAAAGLFVLPATQVLAFTADQVAAGRMSYEVNCSSCHGLDLGVLRTAQLSGAEFMAKWQGRSTSELLSQLRATMPPDNIGGLAESDYLSVIAYILQVNGAAADTTALTAAAGVPKIEGSTTLFF